MSRTNTRCLVRRLAACIFAASAPAAFAQQPAAPFTHATRYNTAGQVTGTIAPDPDGTDILAFKATRNTYGSGATAGLLIKVESGELATWQSESIDPASWTSFAPYLTKTFAYDSSGRKIAERTIGSDGVTESLVQFSYDDWDRVRCKVVRMNKATFASPEPNACQLGLEGAQGPDRITRYSYDEFDQVLTEERAVGTPIAQTYVTNSHFGRGVPASLTDAKGNRTDLRYDDAWRLERRVYPSPSSAGSVNESDINRYEYDANGNVTLEKKRNNQTIVFEYDKNNRLITKDRSDTGALDITYNYDLRGLTLSSCAGATDSCTLSGEGETNGFNGFGELTSRTSRFAGVSRTLGYQYDRESNRRRITHPDAAYFEYAFDGLNRVCAIGESALVSSCASPGTMLTIKYRPSGGRLDILRAGGAVTNINLDYALRLSGFTQNLAGSANDLTNGFQYNAANQITVLSQSNPNYTNWELASRVGSYVPDGLNRYASMPGQPTVGYDGNGNLTNDGFWTYTYDMENRLVSMSGSPSATFAYDVLGRLAQYTVNGTTTSFHYDGDALVGEYVGGALTRRYVHGDQVDEPLVQYNGTSVGSTHRRYLHADHQGSIIAHTDSTGNLLAPNKYDAYGIPWSGNADRFGYTGQTWLKEVGLNYYKARMYSPKLGRFLQTDPIFYSDDMNVYAYVGNDPLQRRDPWGMAWEDNNVAYVVRPPFAHERNLKKPTQIQRNTLVTDGKGGVKIVLNNVSGLSKPVVAAVKVHEGKHKSNFEEKASADSREKVKNAPEGMIVTAEGADDLNKDEISAYGAEVDEHKKSLNDPNISTDDRREVMANKKQAEDEIKRREALTCDRVECK